jgi:bis(5'-nucleosyl)-tetraphosphatase (symmetrical)
VQGCFISLLELLQKLRFQSDRDELIFLGDLVNRGPQSLEVLRHIKAMGGNAVTVLGNHDLHLLAHHFDSSRAPRSGDTLGPILEAQDREVLIGWLLLQPLAIHDVKRDDLFVHAGVVPQWSAADAMHYGKEASDALQENPQALLGQMYGNQPDQWAPDLEGADRWRFAVNTLTRLRFCDEAGRINLKLKDAPEKVPLPWRPWFNHEHRNSRGTRIIFGHWSTLGYINRPDLVALDTGCVWGGQLTAVDLDDREAPPIQVAGKVSSLMES